jgi:hypothetical protein
MATGPFLGGARGLAKIVDTIFNAQFFSKMYVNSAFENTFSAFWGTFYFGHQSLIETLTS